MLCSRRPHMMNRGYGGVMLLSVRFLSASLFLLIEGFATAQVLSKADSGFTAPEAIQVIGHANGSLIFQGLSSLSAQDVNGDGRTDLLVTGQDPASSAPSLTTTLLRSTGNQNFQQIIGNNSNYCLPPYTDPAVPDTVPPFCMLADLNGDGLPDKIFAGEYPNPSNPSEVDYPYVKIQFAAGAATWAAPLKYTLGGRGAFITSLAVGDFNGDGRTDIAALRMAQKANTDPMKLEGYVFVLYGNAQGNFTVSHSYASRVVNTITRPFILSDFYPDMHLASLDLNGDGCSDLIVYNENYGGSYSILLGGSTAMTLSGPSANYFSKLFAADLNRDGFGDLVVQESVQIDAQAQVHVLFGGGRGSQYFGYFARDQVLPLNEYGATVLNILTGDFNRDGLPDLAIGTMWTINIFLQAADGSFGFPRQYPSAGTLLAIGDFNGDRNLDLASAFGNPVSILYGDGFGSFTAPAITSNYFSGALYSNSTIVAGDFNHDGKPDMATSLASCDQNGCLSFIKVFSGSGKGWFQPPKSYTVPSSASTMAAEDVNGDGLTDLVTLDAWGGNPPGRPDTGVLLGKTDGTFSTGKSYTLGASGVNLFLRDVNNDGKLDLVTEAGVALGKGDGSFGMIIPLIYSPLKGCSSCQTIAVGDFNGDGKLDVLYSSERNIHVLLGDGIGHFRETVNSINCAHSCLFSPALAVGDLNGDGKLDFITGITSDPEGGIAIYLGGGDGRFQEVEAYSNAPASWNTYGSWAGAATIRDLNGDGIPDVAILGNGMFVFLGKGDGRFTSPVYFARSSTGFGSSSVAAADMNLDGAPDLAVPTYNGFARVLNTGFATWPRLSSLPPPTPFRTQGP